MMGGIPRGARVTARTRKDIRQNANLLRGVFKTPQARLDVVRLFEHHLIELGGDYHIATKAELSENEALAFPDIGEIHVREDVYDDLHAGDVRARFTIAHEFGHLMLHTGVSLAHTTGPARHPFFEDTEWQANCFAAELLMPAHTIVRHFSTASAVAAEFGVSMSAAIMRLKNLRAEGLLRPRKDELMLRPR